MSVVAGVLVETAPGAAPRVGARLAGLPGVSVEGSDGDRRLALVWVAADGAALRRETERLLSEDPDLLGIHPTFVGREERGEGA